MDREGRHRDARNSLKRIHHVQLTIPAGGEDRGREYYSGLLGFAAVDKPPQLRATGGAWFVLGPIEVHLGVEADFVPARIAHPAFVWDDLEPLAERLAAAGYVADWDTRIEGRQRFYTFDPFGNRLEFLHDSELPSDAGSAG